MFNVGDVVTMVPANSIRVNGIVTRVDNSPIKGLTYSVKWPNGMEYDIRLSIAIVMPIGAIWPRARDVGP